MFSTRWSIVSGRWWWHGCLLEKSEAIDRPSYGMGRKKMEPTTASATSAAVNRTRVRGVALEQGTLNVSTFSIAFLCFLDRGFGGEALP